MTPADVPALMPMVVVAATIVVVLMLTAFTRRHAVVAGVTVAGLAASLTALAGVWGTSRRVTPLVVIDSYALVYSVLVLGAALVTAVLASGYFSRRRVRRREEFYLALLLSTFGGLVLAASNHFASFFLGLETLSVALYGMIAYLRDEEGALEAGIKYLVLAGASSAVLLFGMALIYLETGALAMPALAASLAGSGGILVTAAAALIVAGIGFKIAIVPFHMWTPDVYDGAPAPVTGFLATASKAAVFAVVLRLFQGFPDGLREALVPALVILAAATMLAGNLLALLQRFVKRILAYSSIAHMGYLLVAFIAGGTRGAAAATFYLFAYAVTTLTAFGAISALAGEHGEPETLDDYRALFWRRPATATALAVSLFSLAGIPLTAGFLAKFYVISAGVDGGLWLLLAFLVVNSAISVYYYLRIVVAMFTRTGEEAAAEHPGVPAGIALVLLVGLMVWIGVQPSPLVHWVESAVTALLQ